MNDLKRILLVDDSRDELHGLEQILSEMAEEWKIECAESGALALQKMLLRPFDVVVTDFHMPKMTGEELLRKVMLEYPQTVRIILSGFFDAKVTSRLMHTAHQYLCKPCNPIELKDAISRALFLRDLLANHDLQRVVSQIQALPSLPALYTELMLELQGPDPSIERITRTISRDLGLCTKILQLVNSSFFGLAERIADVAQAVIHLGIEPVKALVLSLQTFALFERLKHDDIPLKPLWNHSWAVGRLAQRIGQMENVEMYSVHQCFTAGLLHDVGKLIFLSGVPKQFASAISLQRHEKIPLWQAEQEIFGCTHAEVGAYLLGLWGLPISVVETVALHHRPLKSATRTLGVTTAVHVADALEREAEPSFHSAPIALLDETYLAELELIDRLPAWRELRSDLVAEPTR